jgi:hypothetical protein
MEPGDRPPPAPPVQVQINGTAGLLLLRLMEQLSTEDGGGVISRALGLLDLALRARREGKTLCFVDRKTGASSDVAF